MSRERLLGSVRRGLDAHSSGAARRRTAEARLVEALPHPRPAGAGDDLVQPFKDRQRALGVELIDVDAPSDIPAAVAAYLRRLALPARLRCGGDPLWTALPWDRAPSLVVDRGPAHDGDSAGLSRAVAGVAETGTLALASGSDNPVTLAFLPDTHLVVLQAAAIVAHYEDALVLVKAETGGPMPRTLNLVTGASRTGDIGGKIVVGAHGPRRLAIFLLGNG
ncbi:MAG: LUD domain-containing protein [Hyphomicrobium sp.]|nr:LUD domain-containing protein [Hyphomicrobium sp.]